MIMSATALVEAARYERDRRASTYPAKIRALASGGGDGPASTEADAEALSIDYQAWVAIVEWLETDRFFSFAGGANPEREDAPIVSWPELELAAQSALVSVAAKAAKSTDAETLLRRHRLFCIHRRIQRHRQWLDETTRQLRAACGAG